VRYDDEFGGYPYILGVKRTDGAILNIFWITAIIKSKMAAIDRIP